MTYWDEEQFWADAATRNCVWLFEIKSIIYPKAGCVCGAKHDDEGNLLDEHGLVLEGKRCECWNEVWDTEYVFLTEKEAKEWGESRPYAWGKEGEGWRAYGVPCCGLMAELLGKHNKEFEKEVGEMIPTMTGLEYRYVVILDNGKIKHVIAENIIKAIECEQELNPKQEVMSVTWCGFHLNN